LICYTAIWLGYIYFMDRHAPARVDWASYHGQRIFNAVEYLRLHGYFSAYGYSIWSSCTDCDLASPSWRKQIYLSGSGMRLMPYIALNHFGGEGALRFIGPLLDKSVIFITGVLSAELLIKCARQVSALPALWVGGVCFALFATSPWTYKMVTAAWMEIWFLVFFLMSLWLFLHRKNRAACAAFFAASLLHFHWGIVIGVVWGSVYVLGKAFSESDRIKYLIPEFGRKGRGMATLIGLSVFALTQELVTRMIVSRWFLQNSGGSSFLMRVGISGDDPHNGAILGALQFLGGNRVTVCLANASGILSGSNLDEKIAAFNCLLSISGMVLVSVAALIGIVLLMKQSSVARTVFFPLLASLLVFASVLQQSMSVHLLGYSYIFSCLFSAGLLGLIVRGGDHPRSTTLTLVMATPVVVAVILLSIRVTMLAGAAG